MFIVLAVSLVLTFSYKIVERFISVWSKSQVRYSVYYWAAIIVIVASLSKGNYIFSIPANITTILPSVLILIVANSVLSRFSGYDPMGQFNIINFVITYPVIEEFIFRGIILSNLNQYFNSMELIEVMHMPVTLSVVITAFLFAITHLQYYRLSRQCIRFMLFAFIGGILFGAITEMTHSILLSTLLHIQFNLLAVYFAKKNKKN